MASGSSLNSVVSSLVRASMGSTVAPTVTDEDLERHVAELIVKEAKAKAETYSKEGIRAYLPHTGLAENNLPKANKRFINSLVKNVSDHNKVILQAQAESAEQIKEKRRWEEAQDRRRRAEEAAEDHRRVKRLMGGGRGDSRSAWRERGQDGDRESERARHRSRSPRRRDASPRRSQSPRRRSRSPRRDYSPRRSHKSSRKEERRDDHKRRRERSPHQGDDDSGRRHSEHKQSSKRSKHNRSDLEVVRSTKGKGREVLDSDHTDRDNTPSSSKPEQQTSSNDLTSRSPSPEHPADHAPSYSSKMDKYFSSTYDPRLDVAQPSVGKAGMLDGPQWEGWEGMLELVQLRAADREEKKRRERVDKEKSKFDKKRAKAKGSSSVVSPAITVPISDVGLMDMKYKKRGATKEWDLAKETPT